MPCGSGSPSHHLLHPCSIRTPPVTKFCFCQWLDVNFSPTLQVLAQIGVLSSCVLSTLARIKDPPLRHFWRPPPNPLTDPEVTRREVPPPLLIQRSLSNRVTNSSSKSSQTRCATLKFKSEWAETFTPILLFTSLNRKKKWPNYEQRKGKNYYRRRINK